MRYFTRILALVWAGFWIFFGLASAIEDKLSFYQTLIHISVPGLLFFVFVLIAWQWEKLGGILLTVIGLVIVLAYLQMAFGLVPLFTIIFVLLTMAFPPLICGPLFILEAKKTKVVKKPQTATPSK